MPGRHLVPADEVVADIGDIIRDTPNEYWGNAGLQRSHADALAARDAGVPVHVVHDPNYAEMERLRALSADDSSAYWEGPRAPELQARYAALLEYFADESRPRGVEGYNPLAAFKTTDAILDSLSDTDREDLQGSFYSLPVGVQALIEAELAAGAPSVTPLPTEVLNVLAANGSATTQAVIEDWGVDAGRRLGVLQYRIGRILWGLSNEEANYAVAWALSLSPGQALAVARALT